MQSSYLSAIHIDQPLVFLDDQPHHPCILVNKIPTLYFRSYDLLEIELHDIDSDVHIKGLANNLEPLPSGRIAYADVKDGQAVVFTFNIRCGDYCFEFDFSCRSKRQTVYFSRVKNDEEYLIDCERRRRMRNSTTVEDAIKWSNQ